MAECTNIDLLAARNAAGLSRGQVADKIHVSVDTIRRWESGETMPSPDDVDRLGVAYEDHSLWHDWMRTHYDSYRDRYPESLDLSLTLSIVNLRHQIGDIMSLQDAAERDAMTGRIDNDKLRLRYTAELKDLLMAAQHALNQISGGAE